MVLLVEYENSFCLDFFELVPHRNPLFTSMESSPWSFLCETGGVLLNLVYVLTIGNVTR